MFRHSVFASVWAALPVGLGCAIWEGTSVQFAGVVLCIVFLASLALSWVFVFA